MWIDVSKSNFGKGGYWEGGGQNVHLLATAAVAMSISRTLHNYATATGLKRRGPEIRSCMNLTSWIATW
jgi:hypothetical protein